MFIIIVIAFFAVENQLIDLITSEETMRFVFFVSAIPF